MSDEARLLAAIRRAYSAGRVAIDVNLRAVSRSGSPSFRTTDIVVPWFSLAAVSVYLAVAQHLLAGLGLLAAGAAAILLWLRPYNRRRTVDRTIAMALDKLEYWQAFWSLGGLSLARPDGRRCAAPEGDWQGFARDLAAAE